MNTTIGIWGTGRMGVSDVFVVSDDAEAKATGQLDSAIALHP